MSFDWSQYLNLACELIGEKSPPADEESKQRAAISRAYYAAFQQSLIYLRDKNYDHNIPSTGQAHEYVQKTFSSHPDEDYKKIGENLFQLRKSRRKADYDDEFSGSLPKTVYLAIKQAKHVLVLLDSLP